MSKNQGNKYTTFSKSRERLYEIIFEADTKEGKLFDIALLIFILASIIIVMLETVPELNEKYHDIFITLEWIFTIFFTIEYFIRIYTVHSPKKYMTSFYGIVDLLSILPTYISIFLGGTQSLMVIRALRLLRVFRIFKLGGFLFEGQILIKAIKESRDKLTVFMFFILILVSIFGSFMYLIEGAAGNEGFDSIPRSVYWAIVTLTTVGYGDISPISPLGQFIAAIIMILGYAVIAVPTGIVSSEVAKVYRKKKKKEEINTQVCSYCMQDEHDNDAIFCKTCGHIIHPFEH
ncbi:MAG: ion transporter [Saprospiraceae bacterium]|nr:ion transporter [Bacteroidia bacterium]NNE15313.1 ion transporter [Saprospiraceae bacterium]NNL93957.1 ion transporter [Saprospiraceae bacterium]